MQCLRFERNRLKLKKNVIHINFIDFDFDHVNYCEGQNFLIFQIKDIK